MASEIEIISGPVRREESGRPPRVAAIPLWLLILYAVSIFWAGATLGGGIRASYFSSDYYGIRPGPGIALRGTSVRNASEETSSIMDLGKAYFLQNCAICHQPNGIGVPGVYPPLAGSPYINGDARRLAMIVLKGIQGTITVDGRKFNGTMPAWEKSLTDKKLSAILTYVRRAFGNDAPPITPEQIAVVRKEFFGRSEPWSETDLQELPANSKLPEVDGGTQRRYPPSIIRFCSR